MKNIDFLPSRYRERTQLRRVMMWRIAALVVLAATIAVAHGSQLAVRRSAAKQLAALGPQYQAALETSARLQQLQNELAANEHYAALYTYLEHPWPSTQILVAITQTLPESLTLTEIRLQHQQSTKTGTAPDNNPAVTSTVPPPSKDLQSLRDEMDGAKYVVTVHGLTTDVSALQEYVSGFQRSPFFASAKLESIESLKELEGPQISRFEMHLEIRPGYGQPGGPTLKPLSTAEHITAETDGISWNRLPLTARGSGARQRDL
jgi:Tfp pilus assembly protein PilN